MSDRAHPPSISILLLCWNHARYLEKCIASLAMQTSLNFNILFLDNASTDGSPELADRLLKATGLQYRLIRNDQAKGISANLNKLLAESTGELVALLSTDDWYAPTFVAKICAAAERYPESALLAGNGWSVFEETGEQLPSDAPSLENVLVDEQFLFDQGYFFWVGLCYRRSALISLGGWDETQPIEDIDLLYRLTRRFPVTQLSDKLVYYRRSASSVSLDPIFMAKGRLKFFQKHRLSFGDKWRELVAEMLRSSAAVAIDRDKLGSSFRLLAHSVVIRPFSSVTWRTIYYLLRATARRIQ